MGRLHGGAGLYDGTRRRSGGPSPPEKSGWYDAGPFAPRGAASEDRKVSEQNKVDLSGLEDAFEWLKGRRNLLIGVVLVALLIVAATSFIRQQRLEIEAKPWRAVFAGGAPWSAKPEDLAQVSTSPDVKQTDAEPFARYWAAVRRFEQNDFAGAVQGLSDVKRDFPNHPLCALKLPNPSAPNDARSAVDRLIAEVQRLDQWGRTLPVPVANPPPQPKFLVTLVTDRGAIVLAPYSDLSPRSSEALAKTALLLKDQFIGRALADGWIEIGQDAEGANVEVKEPPEGFPPYEVNHLSHFAGSVSFRQPPFGKGTLYGDLHVNLKTDFKEDARSTVIAYVAQGLDLLTTIAKDEHRENSPTALKAPVKITDVKVEPIDPNQTQPPPK